MKINNLNTFAERYFSGNLAEKYFPSEGNLDESLQILPQDMDNVVSLMLVAGTIKNVRGTKEATEKAVIRVPIGYGTAEQMSEDVDHFLFIMMNIVNKALSTIHRKIEYGAVVTMQDKGTFFRYLENSAALECRFFITKKEESNG